MNLHLRPISDAALSPIADFSQVNLSRWRVRGNLASQVIEAMLASPGLESHRDRAGAAGANPAELRLIEPPPSFILSAPRLTKHKRATFEAA
jgi:hypothetical protein